MKRDPESVAEAVRRHYAQMARGAGRARDGCGSGCGGTAGRACCETAPGYSAEDLAALPAAAVAASAGCGNPVALARLHPGEVVLDLGSGGGIDVLLSARRVGPGGHAWGVDMTREMLELAEVNRQRSGVTNVGFLEGRIEALPLPDASVDAVISNCVINLSVDKAAALREAWRVLQPGGRLAVYDMVASEPLPEGLRNDPEAWSLCVAGALDAGRYERLLREAGFVDIEVRPAVAGQAAAPVAGNGGCCGSGAALPVGSAFISARKPGKPGLGEGRVSVEPASPGDLPAILHLLQHEGLSTEGVAECLDGFVVARRVMPGPGVTMPGWPTAVPTLVGCAAVEMHGRQALLRSVAVSPPFRGAGVGARLVAAALARARERGAAEAFLVTTTAAAYFARLGFEPVRRQSVVGPVTASAQFAGLCPETAVVMRQVLE